MAFEIDAWKVRKYADNVHHITQQSKNRIRMACRQEDGVGHSIAIRRLGPAEGHDVTTRLAPIVHAGQSHSERLIFPTGWDYSDIVSSFDKAQQIHDPESEYAKAGASSYNRAVDRRIIAAALGTATERTGGPESAVSTASFDSGQIVADGSTGLTKLKITTARALLGNACNEELEIYGPLFFVYSPLDIVFLFNDPTMTGADHVSMQPLMSGNVVQGLMGFTWLPSNQLPTGVTDTNERNSFAFARAGLAYGSNMGTRKERVDERNDMEGHPIQVEIYDEFGAVRVEEKLVVRVDVLTTATPA